MVAVTMSAWVVSWPLRSRVLAWAHGAAVGIEGLQGRDALLALADAVGHRLDPSGLQHRAQQPDALRRIGHRVAVDRLDVAAVVEHFQRIADQRRHHDARGQAGTAAGGDVDGRPDGAGPERGRYRRTGRGGLACAQHHALQLADAEVLQARPADMAAAGRRGLVPEVHRAGRRQGVLDLAADIVVVAVGGALGFLQDGGEGFLHLGLAGPGHHALPQGHERHQARDVGPGRAGTGAGHGLEPGLPGQRVVVAEVVRHRHALAVGLLLLGVQQIRIGLGQMDDEVGGMDLAEQAAHLAGGRDLVVHQEHEVRQVVHLPALVELFFQPVLEPEQAVGQRRRIAAVGHRRGDHPVQQLAGFDRLILVAGERFQVGGVQHVLQVAHHGRGVVALVGALAGGAFVRLASLVGPVGIDADGDADAEREDAHGDTAGDRRGRRHQHHPAADRHAHPDAGAHARRRAGRRGGQSALVVREAVDLVLEEMPGAAGRDRARELLVARLFDRQRDRLAREIARIVQQHGGAAGGSAQFLLLLLHAGGVLGEKLSGHVPISCAARAGCVPWGLYRHGGVRSMCQYLIDA
nr:hypothetical protein [uncultured Xylophilus sp.]